MIKYKNNIRKMPAQEVKGVDISSLIYERQKNVIKSTYEQVCEMFEGYEATIVFKEVGGIIKADVKSENNKHAEEIKQALVDSFGL